MEIVLGAFDDDKADDEFCSDNWLNAGEIYEPWISTCGLLLPFVVTSPSFGWILLKVLLLLLSNKEFPPLSELLAVALVDVLFNCLLLPAPAPLLAPGTEIFDENQLRKLDLTDVDELVGSGETARGVPLFVVDDAVCGISICGWVLVWWCCDCWRSCDDVDDCCWLLAGVLVVLVMGLFVCEVFGVGAKLISSSSGISANFGLLLLFFFC